MAGHCRPLCPLNGRPVRSCIIKSISDIEKNQNENSNEVSSGEEDADEDKENELPDENANYYGNKAEPDCTGKGNLEDIWSLEPMANHTE